MQSELRFRGPPPGPPGPRLGSPPPGPPPEMGGMDAPPPPPFLGPLDGAPPFPHGPPPGPPPESNASRGFDPTDSATSRHTNLGVWDYYEEIPPKLNRVPIVKIYRRLTQGLGGAPYAWRLLKDVLQLAPMLVSLYLACIALNSAMPAVTLYYSSRMFQVVSLILPT